MRRAARNRQCRIVPAVKRHGSGEHPPVNRATITRRLKRPAVSNGQWSLLRESRLDTVLQKGSTPRLRFRLASQEDDRASVRPSVRPSTVRRSVVHYRWTYSSKAHDWQVRRTRKSERGREKRLVERSGCWRDPNGRGEARRR